MLQILFCTSEILGNLVNKIPFIKVSLSEVILMILSISKYAVKSIFDDINHRYALYFKDVTREKLQSFGRLLYVYGWFLLYHFLRTCSIVCLSSLNSMFHMILIIFTLA